MNDRFIIYALSMLTSAFLFISCERHSMDPEFLQTDDICLRVKEQVVFAYDPLTCQIAFNREKCDFRVHKDNMSDYYRLKLDEMPSTEGQKVSGIIYWTNSSSILRRDCTFSVEKVGADGKFWLWNGKDQIGAVIQVVDLGTVSK